MGEEGQVRVKGMIVKPDMTRGIRLGLAAVALLVFLLAVPRAMAAPAWLPATDLSLPGKDSTNSVVAMDDAGDTVALWERQNVLNHNVQVTTRSPGGSFSAPVDLSLGSTDPDVAMTPSGEAVAAWVHFANPNSVIQVATRPPGGSFSAPVDVATTIPNSNPQNLHIAVNAAGDIAVVWIQKDPTSLVDPTQFSVIGSVRPAGGSFSAPAVVSPSPLTVGDDADDPRVAIDAAGDVTAVWQYFDSATPRSLIQAATRPAGGSFSAPVPISETSQDASSPAIAVDSAGDAIAAWVRFDGANSIVQAAARPAAGGFSVGGDLSAAGEDAGSPAIAITPGGEATVAWTRSNGTDFIVQASTGSVGSGFSAPVDLSAVGASAFDPQPAVNSSGATTVVWHRSDGANGIAQASIRPAGGGFSTPVDLSASGQDAVFPKVTMDAAGDATAIWSRSDGTNSIVQAAGYDADAPELRNVSIPATGMVDAPVAFSATPFDVWPIASTGFDFGDGASASGASVSHTYTAVGSYRVTVTAVDAAGTPVAASGTISIAPSNAFEIGRLSLNRKKGTGAFRVTVHAPGRLVLAGKAVKRASKRVKAKGAVKLPIRAKGSALKHLKRRGKVRVALTISFTPDGGTKLAKGKKVTLIKKLKR